MPSLDWERFEQLPGAASANWERLCGAVVRRSFGALGNFRYLAQQPGVEFHLELKQASTTLGKPPRWWGWQCRWYDLPASQQLGSRRRERIAEAIRKTQRHVPGITDWVLWTRRPLTKSDQEWFYGIESSLNLHLWTIDELDAHLVGEAEILRDTYFGDLILTPDTLSALRQSTLAPVRDRWMPEVHVEVAAEHEVRRTLGESRYWPEIKEQIDGLTVSIEELSEAATDMNDALQGSVASLADDLSDLCGTLETVLHSLEGELPTVAKLIAAKWVPRLGRGEGRQIARELRRQKHPSSFLVQAGLARQYDSAKLLSDIQQYLSVRILAVTGPAGSGKTHLGAAVTAASSTRPPGLFTEAWPLSSRGTVNELLERFERVGAKSFVQLLEAVDAAGARAGTRIPVVIDGLNESEDPGNWKEELARLQPVLERLPHVVLVVTLRPSVAGVALPDGISRLELRGFDEVTREAVSAYFEEYKIDPGNVRLPLEQFRDPLFLRIFCEATNPGRDSPVRPEQVPASLVAAFVEFRRNAVKRIADQRGGVRRYEPDILKALDSIALALWNTNQRALPFDDIRRLIGDEAAGWTESLARALRDEGILSAEPDVDSDVRTVILFDAFAGFLIADALVRLKGQGGFASWIAERDTAAALGADRPESPSLLSKLRTAMVRLFPPSVRMRLDQHPQARAHPLAPDILKAFAALAPRHLRTPFWQLVEGDLRVEALVDAADLEGRWLDRATVEAIAELSLLPPASPRAEPLRPRRELFDRFREVRDAVGHPLNAELVDSLLGAQSVADRDLRWSEWVRSREHENLNDIKGHLNDWQSRADRTPEDRLRALWLKWLLTSTNRDLRDLATQALYWYGRGQPEGLFRLTLDSLGTNDPYVPERLLAASFGVMMAAPGELREFGCELRKFLDGLWDAFCAEAAAHRTDHWLIRHYVEGIVGIAHCYYPDSLPGWPAGWRFARPSRLQPIGSDDPRNASRDLVYGFDFSNYTVGRLVPNRGNYQFDHPEYEEVSSWIRARVWDLGWSLERFATVERSIGDLGRNGDNRTGRLEQYLKKYGWVGFFEAAGRLEDEGRSPLQEEETHISDVDIDPSFPQPPQSTALMLPGFLPEHPREPKEWVEEGVIDIPRDLLRCEAIHDVDGPWVALSGFLKQQDGVTRRTMFAWVHGVLVRQEDLLELKAELESESHPGNFWDLRLPEEYYVFAGEMPWSLCAGHGGPPEELQQRYVRTLTRENGRAITVELPAHYYNWESYHSVTNSAGGYPVPAATLAKAFDLRTEPGSLDWCDAQGQKASMTLGPPTGFEDVGHLLYVREDLVRKYCDDHDYELVWFVWGERDMWLVDPMRDRPDWLTQAYADHSSVWRRTSSLGDIGPV